MDTGTWAWYEIALAAGGFLFWIALTIVVVWNMDRRWD